MNNKKPTDTSLPANPSLSKTAVTLAISLMFLVGSSLMSSSLAIAQLEEKINDEKGTEEERSQESRDAWVPQDKIGELYNQHCAVCHAEDLNGKTIGPSLLTDLTHGAGVTELISSIANGYPEKAMPAWNNTLISSQIRALAIFILEKRTVSTGDASMGLGEPPTIPSGTLKTELHNFTLETWFDKGLEHPYSIAPLPDGRILATEKAQGLSVISADGKTKTLIADTPMVFDDGTLRGNTFAGNGWMHDVELHPNFASNGWIYLSHGHRCTGCNTESQKTGEPVVMAQLLRGRIKDNRWVDEEIIWRAPIETYMTGLENGIGARITFDNKGYVYLSLGNMGGNYAGAQDLDKPYAKTLRVHDDGRIPTDNPFINTEGAIPSIWTLGHRNPQGLSYDLSSNTLWEAEHGPRGGDEANVLLPGKNYGWPLVSLGIDYDGSPISYGKKLGIEFDPADLEPTVIDWTPSLGVSNIAFYQNTFNSDQFESKKGFPKWNNNMLVATLAQNDVLRIETDGRNVLHSETLITDLGRIRDIETGWQGEIYFIIEHSTGSSIILMQNVK